MTTTQTGHGLIRRTWRAASLLFFNTLVLLLLLNAGARIALRIRAAIRHDDLGANVQLKGLDTIARAYPGWTEENLKSFLRENHAIHRHEWAYDPFTAFRIRPLRGRYINVSAAGFRLSGSAQPWPPSPRSYNVFLFGGSTTFGVGVPDDGTIAAFLQRELPSARVYNFGVPAFYSSQERARFQQLLASGVKPDLAVFIDGMNEFLFTGEPEMTAQLRYGLDQITRPSIAGRTMFLLRALPLTRIVLGAVKPSEAPAPALDCQSLLARWDKNRKMIEASGAAFGVRTLFVWQPIPTYRYEERYNLFGDWSRGMKDLNRCYEAMAARRATSGDNFLWLADLQQDRRENLYVDAGHYTAAFNQVIARAIASSPYLRAAARPQIEVPASPAQLVRP